MSIIHKQVHDLVSDILTNLSDGEETQFLEYLNNYQYMFLEDEQDNNSEIEFDVTHIIKLFEQSHSIYYNKTSRIYYNYNGRDYVLFNDDHLLYLILEFITNHSQVNTLQKTSIKNKIVKLIKDNNIYETIPDSTTIQNTLNYLSQTMFTNKEYSKLFLIIIGGIILKKKIDNRVIVFTKTNLKAFLTEFNRVISIYFCNINIFNFFKFKYTQDHENLNLIVEDNGKGFDPAKVKSGLGTQSIDSRVKFLSGEIDIDSKIGVGTNVHLKVAMT